MTSGAESSEWIAAGGKRDQNAGLLDASDVRVPDTSGSEIPDVEGTWSYPKEQEDPFEALLAERMQEVQLYAQMNGVSDMVAAQLIVEDAVAAMGPQLARNAFNVREVIDIESETFWRTHRPNEPSSRAAARTPGGVFRVFGPGTGVDRVPEVP